MSSGTAHHPPIPNTGPSHPSSPIPESKNPQLASHRWQRTHCAHYANTRTITKAGDVTHFLQPASSFRVWFIIVVVFFLAPDSDRIIINRPLETLYCVHE